MVPARQRAAVGLRWSENHSLVPTRSSSSSFSPSLSLGSAVGPLFQGHCGGLSSVAVHSLGCPVNEANRVTHNPSYIFHRAFLTTSQQSPQIKRQMYKEARRGERDGEEKGEKESESDE